MSVDYYTYRVTWSPDDGEHLALCVEFPSLSWLAATPEAALKGIRQVVCDVLADMKASGEAIPVSLAEKHYSGEFPGSLYLDRSPRLRQHMSLLVLSVGTFFLATAVQSPPFGIARLQNTSGM